MLPSASSLGYSVIAEQMLVLWSERFAGLLLSEIVLMTSVIDCVTLVFYLADISKY